MHVYLYIQYLYTLAYIAVGSDVLQTSTVAIASRVSRLASVTTTSHST